MKSIKEQIMESEDYEFIANLSEEAIDQYPNDSDIIRKISFSLCDPSIGKYKRAINLLKKVIHKQANIAELHEILAHCYTMAGEYHLACEELKKAIKESPKKAELYFMLATTITTGFGVKMSYEDAIEYLQKAINIAPDKWEYHHALGITYWQNGKVMLAKEQFVKALGRMTRPKDQFLDQIKKWIEAIDEGKSYWEANVVR